MVSLLACVRPMTLSCILAALFAGCGSAPVADADPAEVERQEQRLLSPFQTDRVVVADRLDVVMTANFYDELGRPALLAGFQDEERRDLEGGGSELVMRNRSPNAPLRFLLGATDLRILREARIVVLGGRSDMRLEAELAGGVSVVEAGDRRDFESLRIADGAFQRRP